MSCGSWPPTHLRVGKSTGEIPTENSGLWPEWRANEKGKAAFYVLQSDMTQGEGKGNSGGLCWGAKAAQQVTVELCKVCTLKSQDINPCHRITQVLSKPLSVVIYCWAPQPGTVYGEVSKTHTSSGEVEEGTSPRAG